MKLKVSDIIKRLDCLSGDLPINAREALRKARGRNQLPSLRTLKACAEAKGTTVSYLIGEIDSPQLTQEDTPQPTEAAE